MTLEELKGKTFGNVKSEEENDTANQKLAIKIYKFTKKQIEKLVISDSDSSLVYGIITVNDHKETIDLGSSMAIQWLKTLYFEENGDIHSDETFSNILSMIAAQARQSEETERMTIFNRIAMTTDAIYYDLCSQDWQAVKITKNGYEVVRINENTPIFTRKQQQLPQVLPKKEKDNALDKLIKLLRVSKSDQEIFKIHIITFFLEKYPIPMAIVSGEHGSTKSTLTKSIARIIDPSGMNISSIPTNTSDIALHLNSRYISNFDNVSEISQDVSDMFCRAITGEGYSKRKLYTDSNEIIWNYKRKILLNGISPILEFPDFKDRSIFYETVPISEEERMSEEEFNHRLESLMPSILHEIFTILSYVLLMYRRIKKEIKVKLRMADFTIFGECISRMLKNPDLAFVEIYKKKLDSDSLKMVDSYPIVKIILEIMQDEKSLETSMGDFYKKVSEIANANDIDTKSSEIQFPRAINQLSRQINQLKSTLRKHDLEIQIKSYESRDGKYTRGQSIIYISKLDSGQKTITE